MHSTAGEDYTTSSVTVTFQAAETSQVVMVPISFDNLLEGEEQFTAQLSLPAGQDGVVLGANTATVEITDDDCEILPSIKCACKNVHDSEFQSHIFHAAVIIEFNPASYIVPEGEEQNLRIVKVGEASIAVSVLISTVDGTAGGRLCSFDSN